jgi:hypothetical protein
VYFLRPIDEVLREPVEKYKHEPVVAVGEKIREEKVYTAGEWMARRLKMSKWDMPHSRSGRFSEHIDKANLFSMGSTTLLDKRRVIISVLAFYY